MNLEQTLDALLLYGRPYLHFFGSGWFCSCTSNTAGYELTIKSEFLATASAAASQCLMRCQGALPILQPLQQLISEGNDDDIPF